MYYTHVFIETTSITEMVNEFMLLDNNIIWMISLRKNNIPILERRNRNYVIYIKDTRYQGNLTGA